MNRAAHAAIRKLRRVRREPGTHCIHVARRTDLDDADMAALSGAADACDAKVEVDGRWVFLTRTTPYYPYDPRETFADPPEA